MNKETSYRVNLSGADSDKINILDFIKSQPEGMDFTLDCFNVETYITSEAEE